MQELALTGAFVARFGYLYSDENLATTGFFNR
jgi:hypothetical protein